MRLLADENFPKSIVEALRSQGHDVLWVRTELAGSNDAALLEIAESRARVILTLDKDFWQIAFQRRKPLEKAGVVLFRVHPAVPDTLEPLVRAFLDAGRTWSGHVSIVSASGIHIRNPDDDRE